MRAHESQLRGFEKVYQPIRMKVSGTFLTFVLLASTVVSASVVPFKRQQNVGMTRKTRSLGMGGGVQQFQASLDSLKKQGDQILKLVGGIPLDVKTMLEQHRSGKPIQVPFR